MALKARHPASKKLKPLGAREARAILQTKVRNPWIDIGRSAQRIAPAKPLTAADIQAQHRWARDPSRMDMQGIDIDVQSRPMPVGKLRSGLIGYGAVTQATGADPNRVYQLHYRVVPLMELVTSHTSALAPNPLFPEELQPRLRSRVASRLQIEKMARALNPDALLVDVGALDRGPMIIGPDMVVESGNGRALALLRAREQFPERLEAYNKRLRELLPTLGLEARDVDGIKHPILVRERETQVDRVRFAAEANESSVLAMSPLETALQDANRIPDAALATFSVGEGQSIDQALRSAANRPFIQRFVGTLAPNEAASLMGSGGELNLQGLQRVKGAIFAKVFPGEAGQRLTQVFLESLDPTIKTLELAIFDALPDVARAEALVRNGQRRSDLAIGDDIARVTDMLSRLKARRMSVKDLINQASFVDKELDPFEEKILSYFDSIGRSRKQLRGFLRDYADAVNASPHPSQGALFEGPTISKEEIVDRIIERQDKERKVAQETSGPLFRDFEA